MSNELQNFKEAMDEFSLDIYKRILENPESAKGNVFISPLSISSALLLVLMGAKGSTRSEIEQALQLHQNFSGKEQELLSAFGEVLRVFVPTKGKDGTNAFDLALANKAYLQRGLRVKPEFLQIIQKSLHSEVGEADFQNNSAGEVKTINSWVEKKTNNKIRDLLTTDVVTSDTVFVLVNAIYFKADWLTQFEKSDTQDQDFFNLNGGAKKVPLMYREFKKIHYGEVDGMKDDQGREIPAHQTIELEYKDHELSMLILLPKKRDGLAELEKALPRDAFKHVSNGLRKRDVRVWMPRFKLEEQYELVDTLKKLGVSKVFQDADMSGMVDKDIFVSAVIHKAFVEVNEEGTEAAAATAAAAMARSLPAPPVVFRADHPFMFAVRHAKTGLIVFLGRVGSL